MKIKSNDGKGPRIGVIVGKSVHKAAAKRNFWKRQTRDVLAPLVRGDCDVVVILSARVNELSKLKFRQTLKNYV